MDEYPGVALPEDRHILRLCNRFLSKPLQKPHPPILIGGVGPKVTLWIIAEMGDACNLWGPPEGFTKKREMLKRHCDEVGRDESTIEKTTYDLVICAPTKAELRGKVERLLPAPRGIEP